MVELKFLLVKISHVRFDNICSVISSEMFATQIPVISENITYVKICHIPRSVIIVVSPVSVPYRSIVKKEDAIWKSFRYLFYLTSRYQIIKPEMRSHQVCLVIKAADIVYKQICTINMLKLHTSCERRDIVHIICKQFQIPEVF